MRYNVFNLSLDLTRLRGWRITIYSECQYVIVHHYPPKSRGHWHCGSRDLMFLVCLVIHHPAKFGDYKHSYSSWRYNVFRDSHGISYSVLVTRSRANKWNTGKSFCRFVQKRWCKKEEMERQLPILLRYTQ